MVANSIHDVFQPFYQCGTLLGLFCYTFVRPSHIDVDIRARTSVRNVVLLCVNVLFILLSMVYKTLGTAITDMTTRSLVLDRSLKFTFKYGILFSLITYALLFVFRKRIAGIVCDLCRIDAELIDIGIRIDHQQHRRRLIISCISFALVQLALMLSTYLMGITHFPVPFSVAVLNISIYVYTTMTYSTVMSTYALALYALQLRIVLLNQHIRQAALWTSDRVRTVQRIGLIYERLTEIGNMCNLCFAIPAMLSVLLAFGYNMICIYTLCMSLAEVSDLFGMQVALNVAWNVFFMGFVVMVVHAGSKLARMGRSTGQAIHWVLNTMQCVGETDAVRRQLAVLSQQVLHKHPVASAGLFNFDWTLIYAMIATSGTYLIIMVQLDSAHGVSWTTGPTQ